MNVAMQLSLNIRGMIYMESSAFFLSPGVHLKKEKQKQKLKKNRTEELETVTLGQNKSKCQIILVRLLVIVIGFNYVGPSS